MSLSGMRVIVTGATGFIGSHLVERLVIEGAKVRAFCHYNGRRDLGALNDIDSSIARDVELILGDIRSPEAVHAAVTGQQIVFHLAALIAIPYSYGNPRDFVETNVLGTLNVLNAARAHSVQRVVQTSTSEVYGSARTVPMNEDHPLQAQSPYAASKIAADKLAESYWCSFATPVVVIRPFNTYGPRQSPRAVIPTIILQALAGGDINLGSLDTTRDFMFVSDTANGFIRAAAAVGTDGAVINLGTGVETAVGDVATRVMSATKSKGQIRLESMRQRPRASEVERLIADPSRAHQLLGWKSMVTLDEGLSRSIAWFSPRRDRYVETTYYV